MSYILDALKKSDQERQSGKGPSLQTVHSPKRFHAASNDLKWVIAILLCILLALVAFLGQPYWQRPASQTTTVATVPKAAAVSPQATMTAPVQSRSEQSKPILNTAAIRFVDLDADMRAEIPSLTFSFHVYSENPQRRTIIINNRRVREGQLVEKGLLLEEITELGVVFIWQDKLRFSIDVVQAW